MNTQPGFTQSAGNTAWHRLSSPALSRIVAVELLAQADHLQIPDEIRGALRASSLDARGRHISDHLTVWVNVEPLRVFANHLEEKQWHTSALHYCIRRQAHYPLLRQLFDTRKADVTRLRSELGVVVPPTRNKQVSDHELVEIWRCWSQIKKTYEREIDQWIKLAERFSSQPLSVLHQVLITDAYEMQP